MASFFPTSRFPGSALVYRAKAFLTLSMGLASASSVAFSQDSTPIIPPIVPIYGQESPTPSNPPEEESNPAPKDSASMDTGKTEEVPATTEIPPVIPLLPNLELEFESPSESGSVTESGLDQEALDRFDTATSQEQLELLHLYAEYGNSAMVDALSQKFLERNPGDPAANEIMATFAVKNRHPKEAMFYTEQLMAVNPSTKAKVLRASALSLAKRPAEAVPILQRLKAENKEEIFPQQVDLSFALLESGRTDAAKSAFEEIVNTPGYSPDIVAEAESQLAGIHFNQLVAHGDRAIENDDLETAREMLQTLETEFEPNEEMEAFSARVLAAEGKPNEALTTLRDLKSKEKGEVFENQLEMGQVHMDMKNWELARDSFQEVIDTPGYSAKDVAAARAARRETHLHEQVRIAEEFAKKRDAAKVRQIADWAIKHFPDHPEAQALDAKAYALEGNHEAAEEILTRLESQTKEGERFGHAWELAEAKFENGDFDDAAARFDRFIETPGLRSSERVDAFFTRERLRRDYLGQLRAGAEFFDGEEGQHFGAQAYGRTGISANGWRMDATYRYDEVDLSNDLLSNQGHSRQEGALGIEKFFGRGHFIRGYAGASDSDALGGLAIGKSARSVSSAWMLAVAVNDRATDSLTLRALDGREHRVGFDVMREITERAHAAMSAFVRRIDIDGSKLGTGFGSDWELAYRLNRHRSRTNYAIAYTGSYHQFNPDGGWRPSDAFRPSSIAGSSSDSIASQLVDEEYHRHGLELRLTGLSGNSLATHAHAGAHYRFDGVGFEYSLGAGFEWLLTPSTSLFIDTSYVSNGRVGNEDDGVFEASASLRHSF